MSGLGPFSIVGSLEQIIESLATGFIMRLLGLMVAVVKVSATGTAGGCPIFVKIFPSDSDSLRSRWNGRRWRREHHALEVAQIAIFRGALAAQGQLQVP